VYRPTAYLYITAVVTVFILCSDPVYCMSSFVFCFSKLTQQLLCLVWYVSFVVVMCICLCMLFVVTYCITAVTGLTTNLQSNNNNNNNDNTVEPAMMQFPLAVGIVISLLLPFNRVIPTRTQFSILTPSAQTPFQTFTALRTAADRIWDMQCLQCESGLCNDSKAFVGAALSWTLLTSAVTNKSTRDVWRCAVLTSRPWWRFGRTCCLRNKPLLTFRHWLEECEHGVSFLRFSNRRRAHLSLLSRSSSADVATSKSFSRQSRGGRFQADTRHILLHAASRPSVGTMEPSVQCIRWAISPGERRPEPEADVQLVSARSRAGRRSKRPHLFRFGWCKVHLHSPGCSGIAGSRQPVRKLWEPRRLSDLYASTARYKNSFSIFSS
jgi:hypothetical protein